MDSVLFLVLLRGQCPHFLLKVIGHNIVFDPIDASLYLSVEITEIEERCKYIPYETSQRHSLLSVYKGVYSLVVKVRLFHMPVLRELG